MNIKDTFDTKEIHCLTSKNDCGFQKNYAKESPCSLEGTNILHHLHISFASHGYMISVKISQTWKYIISLTCALLVDDNEKWDTRSVRSIRSFVSKNIPESSGILNSLSSNEDEECLNASSVKEEKKKENRQRFW